MDEARPSLAAKPGSSVASVESDVGSSGARPPSRPFRNGFAMLAAVRGIAPPHDRRLERQFGPHRCVQSRPAVAPARVAQARCCPRSSEDGFGKLGTCIQRAYIGGGLPGDHLLRSDRFVKY